MMRESRYLVFLDAFWMLPIRIKRLFQHFLPHPWKVAIHPKNTSVVEWSWDLMMLIMDVSGLPDILLQVRLLLFPGIRPLNEKEKALIKSILGNSLDISKVWMDPVNRIGTIKYAHAYVLHHSINYFKSIKDDVLIHEAVHILQYQQLGSIYISRALVAQHSTEAYNYNGGQGLYNAMMMGKRFWDFNFEQQGQIVQDYYCILIGKRTVSPIEYTAYTYYINEVKKINISS
jgi:hypothetical protein